MKFYIYNPFEDLSQVLSRQLRARGIDSKIITHGDPEWKEFKPGQNFQSYIELYNDNIAFIGIRMVGENTRSNHSKGQIKSGYYRVEFHYVVHKDIVSNPRAYKATLQFITRGMFTKEITGVEWKGRELSQMLSNDLPTTECIRAELKPYESITIKPDAKNHYVHIILKTRLSVEYMVPGQTSGHELPSRPLFYSIEQIAKHVKDFAS